MPFADWGAIGQITRIRRRYLEANIPIAMLLWHRLEIIIGTLVNGATASPAPLLIPPDYDFLWMGNLITPHPDQSTDANGPAGFATLMRAELMHDDTRRLGMHRDQAGDAPNGWMPLMNVCGRARMPFLWPWPILLRGSGAVKFDFVHRGSVDLVSARLTLLGVKILKGMAS